MQEANSIYDFLDAIDYLNFEFESKRIKNTRFSLRSWSRQLGYENPSFVFNLLKRKRSLKINVAKKFSHNLKLTGDHKRYFELLVLLGNCKTVEEKTIYLDLIENLKPKSGLQNFPNINIESFRIISDWYHTAILEMVELVDFENDSNYIYKRLGNEISIQNINRAIERLIKLNLLEKTSWGKLKRVKDCSLELNSLTPNIAIRHFHKQMIEKGMASINEQHIDQRDIRGSMITIRTSDYDKIIDIIKNTHRELTKLSTKGKGEEVYQFNSQFFKITKNRGKI